MIKSTSNKTANENLPHSTLKGEKHVTKTKNQSKILKEKGKEKEKTFTNTTVNAITTRGLKTNKRKENENNTPLSLNTAKGLAKTQNIIPNPNTPHSIKKIDFSHKPTPKKFTAKKTLKEEDIQMEVYTTLPNNTTQPAKTTSVWTTGKKNRLERNISYGTFIEKNTLNVNVFSDKKDKKGPATKLTFGNTSSKKTETKSFKYADDTIKEMAESRKLTTSKGEGLKYNHTEVDLRNTNKLKVTQSFREKDKIKSNVGGGNKLYTKLQLKNTKPSKTIEAINALHGKLTPSNAKETKSRPKSEHKEKSITYNPVLTAGNAKINKESFIEKKSPTRAKSSFKKSDQEIKLNEGSLSTEASNHFRGRIEDYAVGKEIGKGAYALVKQALHKPTNRKMAVKIYDKVKLLDAQRKNSVKREIMILKKLDCVNIVKLVEVIDNPKQILLIMELVEGVSLLTFLKSKNNRRLEENECKEIFLQIVSAISHCHSKSICHRDIKLENIIVDEQRNVKLIDFGFGAITIRDKLQNFFCGTPSYMPPEIVQKRDYEGLQADIWSLGILLYTLLCGMFPFRAMSEKELYSKIIKGLYSFPEHMSPSACDLVRRLLSISPNERPQAEMIQNDPWFTGESREIPANLKRNDICLDTDPPRTFHKSHSLVLKSKAN